jgi:hypothetical protein
MPDPVDLLHRFEADLWISSLALAAIALLVPGGGLHLTVAVLAGGALVWVSYRTLKAGVNATMARARPGRTLVKVFTRYGMLALGAYVMLARLRLHPVGVLIGASSLALAAAAAAVRCLWSSGPVRSTGNARHDVRDS